MRQLFFLIVGVLYLILSTDSTNALSCHGNYGSETHLFHALPDSVYSQVKGNPMILYSSGHYGYLWSIIIRTDTNFRAFNGKVSYGGDNSANIEASKFDSTLFFSKNRDLLLWAFDTISTETKKMKIVNREQYFPIFTDISVINSKGVDIFSSYGATAFPGSDSMQFNQKFQKLLLIMSWLSNPKIRQYIPDDAIF